MEHVSKENHLGLTPGPMPAAAAAAAADDTAVKQRPTVSPLTTPQQTQNGSQSKRSLADESQNTEDGMNDQLWQTVGGNSSPKKSRIETDELMDQESNDLANQVGDLSVLKIKFIEESVQENIIYDNATILKLLNSSLFAGAYEGTGRKLSSKHELILNIKDTTKTLDLLKVKYLQEDDKKWPIVVSLIERNHSDKIFGVMKIHPLVPEHRIKEELQRNHSANLERGCNITDIYRIQNKDANSLYPTWSVKLTFMGKSRPPKVLYGDESMNIQPYYPKLVLCSKCAKAGHIAKHCNSLPRCSRCGRGHIKDNCPVKVTSKTNKSVRRCPNCSKNHFAGYGGCDYIKVEKEVIRQHAEQNTPRTELRRTMWAEIGTHGKIQRTRPHQPQPQQQAFHLDQTHYPVIQGGSTQPQDPQQEQTQNEVTLVHTTQEIQGVTRDQNQNRRKPNQQLNQTPGPNQQDHIQSFISEERNKTKTPRSSLQKVVQPAQVVTNEVENLKKDLAKQMEGIIQFLVLFIGLLPQDANTTQKLSTAAKQIFGEKVDLLLLNHHHTKQEPLDLNLSNTAIIHIENIDGITTFSAIDQNDTTTSPQQHDGSQ